MVNRPATLDTIVATNLHADILSDLAAALAGSLGIAPTGNIDPERRYPSHVRADPRLGLRHHGQGPGQPGGHLLVGVMLLEHLGERVKTIYVPFKGTGDMATSVMGAQVDGAMTYTAFAINNKTRIRPLAVAMERRHPLMPDVPTFKELGVDWVDGAYRGIGVPKGTSAEARKKLSDMWRALNNDPEMKELAAKSGFELVNVGVEEMDAFMKEKISLYTEGAGRLGLGKK
jgi:tripartite-type tricarboxylate transporter receptor subunit TctC